MKNFDLALVCASFLLVLSSCSSSDDNLVVNADDSSSISSDDSNENQTLRLIESIRNLSDGTIETISSEYSESGNMVRDTVRRNGEIAITRQIESTPDGQLIRRSEDIDQDGFEDNASLYEYTDGPGLTRIYRVGPDKLIYAFEVFQFDGNVAVSSVAREIDDATTPDLLDENSGTFIARFNFAYEEDQLVEKTRDDNDDGIVDSIQVYSYNPDGTLASTTNSSVAGGVIDSTTYVYEAGKCNNNFGNSVNRYYCVTIK